MAFFITQMTQTQEEHDMFRSKPNHCISLRRNVSRSSPYPIHIRTPQGSNHNQWLLVSINVDSAERTHTQQAPLFCSFPQRSPVRVTPPLA